MGYASKDIRNILVAGHAGCGKTTLTEALLYMSGATERMGRVEDGTTASDFDPEETRRKASLNASVVPVEYEGIKYNLIDAPGLFDFETGAAEGIMAAESVLICVSGRSGVTVGAEKAYQLALKNNKARMIFVTKTDLENADYFKILEQMKIKFGPSVCPCVVPVRLDDGTVAYINLFSQKAFKYEGGKQVQIEVPDIGHRFEGLIQAMSEAIAETDEALMEKFFEGEAFTTEEIVQGMAAGVRSGQITPVFCGSAVNMQALDMLLYNMNVLLPGADTAAAVAEDKDGSPVDIAVDDAAPLCAYVFKTVADPFVGKLSFIKVLSGKLTAASNAVNARTGQPERMGKTLTVCGKKQTDTAEIAAGDIGAVAKLATAKTGDTLCDPARVVALPAPVYPVSCYRMAVKVAKKGDEGKVSGALARLIEEDPAISFVVDPETKQQIISGLGTQHLEVALAKLKNKFGVEITLEAPRVPYRESIRKSCKAQGRHKKQTGGHGQFGDVWIQFEPVQGEGIEFAENVFGGSVPKNFFPAVEKGVRQAAEHGVLAGYPMVGMKATLLDGSYHPVDSSEMAFIMAAKIAYKAAIPEAGPVLLEPIAALAGKAQNRHIIACVIGQLRLIVAQHQAADRKNLRVGIGGPDKLGQPVRLGKGVVVEQDCVLALGDRNALVYRVGKAGVVGVFNQGVAVAATVAARNRKAFIGGAVVDDDQLKILLGLCPDRLDGIPQPACAVQVRDDDRCFHGVSLPEIGVGVVVGETGVQHSAQHQRTDQQEHRKGDCHHGGADQIGARQPPAGGVAGAAEAPHQRQNQPDQRDGKEDQRGCRGALAHGSDGSVLVPVRRVIQRLGRALLRRCAGGRGHRCAALGAAVGVMRHQQAAVFAEA